MLPKFIKKCADLQTKHRAICDGFLEQAIKKAEKAEPYVKEAKHFCKVLKKTRSVAELITSAKYRDDLAYACGFSDKAKSKLTQAELNSAIKKVLIHIQKVAGSGFREDILYRYLLTKGDSLGGSMRNLTGSCAGNQLTKKIIQKLSKNSKQIKIVKSKKGKTQKVIWSGRTLFFDATPRLIRKNIDVILVKSENIDASEKGLPTDKSNYLAFGELKGGIDPAGADEHWKTANSALGRIRTVFGRRTPALFFVGAAIEPSMSKEIFRQLKNDKLTYAANLNEDKQVSDLVDWLLSL